MQRQLGLFAVALGYAVNLAAAIPITFEQNLGQASGQARFLSRGFGHAAAIAPASASFAGPRGHVTMRLASVSETAELAGVDRLPGLSNYFRGSDPSAWRTGVPQYSAVRGRNLYPGIDILYHGGDSGLEFDFIVAPGADPSRIRLRFDARVRLTRTGDLAAAGVRFHKPRVFQDRNAIPARFRRAASGEYTFSLGAYDPTLPLTIDPLIEFTTVIGASGDDRPTATAFDAAGNIYILGVTNSLNFPLTAPLQPQIRGDFDVFLLKLNPTGRVTLFSTYLGGGAADGAFSLAVDAQGNAWICGSTDSNNFPVTRSAYQVTYAGGRDAFVAKVNPTGSALVFATYLGSTGRDEANGVALDAAGNAYVAGFTNSNTFPVSNGAFQNQGLNGDVFLVKFSSTGSVNYSSVFGGNAFDSARGVAVTSAGVAYVVGDAQSRNFPVTPDARSRSPLGNIDAFLSRLSADGKTLEYSTFLNLPQDLNPLNVAADDAGNIYVAGSVSLGGAAKAVLATLQASGGTVKLTQLDGCCGTSGTQRWNALSMVKGADGKVVELHAAGSTDIAVNADPPGDADFRNCPRFGLLRAVFNPDGTEKNFGCNGGLGVVTAIAARPGAIYLAGTTDRTRDPGSQASDVLLVYLRDLDRFPQRPTAASQGNQGTASDPVATGSGEFYTGVTDIDGGGLPGLAFRRYYASFVADNAFGATLGANWTSNFDVRLGILGNTATLQLPRGKNVQFQKNGSLWALLGAEQRNYQLVQTSTGFQAVDPGVNLIYSFTSNGTLTQIQDRNGNVLTVTAGPDGPLSIADAAGRRLSFTYEAGRVTRITDQVGRTVTLSYSGELLVSATDPLGKVTRYNYAPGRGALLAEIVRPAGNSPVKQSFDSRGRVVAQNDGLGNATRFEYDRPVAAPPPGVTAAAETRITDPLGNAMLHVHQAQEALLSVTDADGHPALISYDANNHRSSVTDRAGGTLSAQYDPFGNLTAYTDAAGNSTRFAYTPQQQGQLLFYNLTRIDYPDGTSSTMSYDNRGNVVVLTDQGGNRWTYSYDDRGHVSTITNPVSGVTIYQYNPDGTLQSVRLPSGDTLAFASDDRLRPSKVTFPEGATRAVAYDAANRVLQLTDERGKTVAFAYDDNGNLRSLADAFSQARTLSYDAADRPTGVTDRLGNRVALGYNAAGSLTSIGGPAGDKLTLSYDASSRPVSLADAAGKTTFATFSSEGVPLTVTDALARAWSFSSDKMGRITRVTTPSKATLDFSFDSRGRFSSFTDPLGRASRFSYEERGLVSGFLSPGGIGTSLARNNFGRILQLIDPNGQRWNFSYDSMGRLLQRSDPLNRRMNYAWDARGRLASAAYAEGALALRYDAAGNLTAQSYSGDGGSFDIPYNYDDANRVTDGAGFAIGYDANGRVLGSNGVTLERDAAGRVAAVTYAAGKTVRYSYNERGLLAQVSDWAGGVVSFTWDDARQLTLISRPNNTGTSYLYDADGRVASISERVGDTVSQIALQRDAAGRVTSSSRTAESTPALAAGITDFAYNEAGQPAGVAHNSLGRPLADSGRTYSWDLAGRLVSVSSADGVVTFTYDGLGSRIARSAPDRVQNFVVNYGLPRFPVAIARDGDADRTYYVSLPDGTLLYSIDAADSRRFYHFDENGSTAALTDDSGAVTDTYQIAPFGEVVSRTGVTANPFTWLGRFGVMQEDVGMFWVRPRMYDARQARYLAPAAVTSIRPEDANPYAFPRNPTEGALSGLSGIALSIGPAGTAASGIALSGIAPAGAAPAGATPAGATPGGIALSGTAASGIGPALLIPFGLDDRPPQPAEFFAALPRPLISAPPGAAVAADAVAPLPQTETFARKGPVSRLPATPPRGLAADSGQLAGCSGVENVFDLLLATSGPIPGAGDLASFAQYTAWASAGVACSPDKLLR